MKKFFLILAAGIFVFTGCKKEMKSDNPFFNEWDTPFEVPPFDQIKASHFMPAYLKAFEENKNEIKAIINNPKAPTFEK